jgi:hypothetical protein
MPPIVEHERVGICISPFNWYEMHRARVAVQSKQFQLFPPHAVEWLVLDRLACSLRQIKPLCRWSGFKEHVTPLIPLASLAYADQAFRGASSCLYARKQARGSRHPVMELMAVRCNDATWLGLTAARVVNALAGLDLPLTLPFFYLLISPY